MYTLLVILYILVALFLIMVVLLQSGKGASMGAAFGGAAQTMFGARGQASGIEKVTVYAAAIFMVLSVVLASMSAQTRSSLDAESPPEKGEAGLMPAPEKNEKPKGASPAKTTPATPAATQPAATPQGKPAAASAAPDAKTAPKAPQSGATPVEKDPRTQGPAASDTGGK